MAAKYAGDQPNGFTNKIEKVAIVGVSQPSTVAFRLIRAATHAYAVYRQADR